MSTSDRDALAKLLYDAEGFHAADHWGVETAITRGRYEGQADAILASDWLTSVKAEAGARALEDAADEFFARLPDGTPNGRAYNSYRVASMLRDRAADLRGGGEG